MDLESRNLIGLFAIIENNNNYWILKEEIIKD
jgi:hypothetical protein